MNTDREIHVDPTATFERIALDGTSWVDVSRNWVSGSQRLFNELLTTVPWQTTQLFRYEQFVEERRLSSGWRRGRPLPHPALAEITRTIQRKYRVEFPSFGIIQYRDGNDGQGFHRDTDMRWLDDTVIAVLTLGAKRPWLLRPRENRYTNDLDSTGVPPQSRFGNSNSVGVGTKGATHDLSPACGDLLVLGGRCQADWEHSVAYLRSLDVGVRISLQWRAVRKVGEPFMGASFRAGVSYGHGKAAPRDT
jgi:alkylated DNA repair dioxygenase AlkB